MVASDAYRELGEAAWTWVLGHLREDDGPWMPASATDDWESAGPQPDRDSLYAGIGGLAPTLAEIAQHRALTQSEQDVADRVVARLSDNAAGRVEPSLYDGLAGDATALTFLAPDRVHVAMQRLAQLKTAAGWKTSFDFGTAPDEYLTDIVLGTAGIILAAIWSGDERAEDLATTGGEALLAAADASPAGLDWTMLPGAPSRSPNYSHGTAGVSSALAIAGATFGRADFVDAAVLGAQHLLSVGSLDDDGFIAPHTIPPSSREVEPVTYTWCHGPTGCSYFFAALSYVGIAEVSGHDVAGLRQRCLTSVLSSGLPQRLRPGFWDNDGRCCGTAGVGEALLDAAQDCADPGRAATLLAGACTMGDALVERAIRDDAGARWRFVEYRDDPPLLPPGTSWMQGATGIAAFLFRLTRVLEDGVNAPVVDRPDQWWAVPARLRTVRTAG